MMRIETDTSVDVNLDPSLHRPGSYSPCTLGERKCRWSLLCFREDTCLLGSDLHSLAQTTNAKPSEFDTCAAV